MWKVRIENISRYIKEARLFPAALPPKNTEASLSIPVHPLRKGTNQGHAKSAGSQAGRELVNLWILLTASADTRPTICRDLWRVDASRYSSALLLNLFVMPRLEPIIHYSIAMVVVGQG
jgi:hypothetical protein